MCEYRLVVSTPLVCSKQLEVASLRRLDDLGVFGFSKRTGGVDSAEQRSPGQKQDQRKHKQKQEKGNRVRPNEL